MARQVPHRAPDGIRFHNQDSVGFAHLALNSTEEAEHELQPLVGDGGRLVLVADARVDNRDELIETLRMPRPEAGPIGDGALILAAWRRWREDCPRHILGDFAFVVWEVESRTLFAARDPLGVNPLHYARFGDVLCVASEAQQILRHPACPRRLDEEVVARWLVGEVEPDTTPFVGIRPLPAAHWLAASPAATRTQRYWDINPTSRIRYKRISDYAEHLREVLRQSVAARLRAAGDVIGSEMSGGMDSTTVTAFAHELLRQSGKKHIVFSFVYPTLKECDESRFIDAVAESLGLDLHRLDGEGNGALDFPQGLLRSPESPATVRNPLSVAVAERLAVRGGRVLLTGNGGDEFMWGNRFSYGRRFWRGDVRVFWEVTRYCWSHGHSPWPAWRALFISPYVPEVIKRRIRALRVGGRGPRWPDWLPEHAGVRLGLSTRRRASMPKGLNLSQREIYDRALSGAIRPVLDTYSTSMGALGVEARHPFLDRRLAEFVFAAPVELWMRQGWPKWLLRCATEGVLPDSVRWRDDKTAFAAYVVAGLERNRAWVEEVLSDPDLQERGLIDNVTLVSRFRSALTSGLRKGINEIAWPLATQAWFQHCRGAFGALPLEGSNRDERRAGQV
jgi:asparagine synthase (glutamine-hydrolysing)